MNKSKLKSYAPAARRAFIQAVTDRAHFWGLSEKGCLPVEEKGDVAIVGGRPYTRKVGLQVKGLAEHIKREGFSHVMEEVAYTWFNRFMALRYMELHDYLEHGFRVLSNRNGSPIPEILEQAVNVRLPGLNPDHVAEMRLDGTKDGELYRMLLVAQCNALHEAMPFLFERIDDETELLLPDNLLHSDSLIRKLVTEIDEEDWQEIQIIGWLYQFYISEKKDQVIGKVVKSEDIPAATQLFTPNWIVKYMVQNSLGRKWLATYPNSPLRQKMDYYIEPAEQTPEVNAQLKAITPNSLDPELLTFLDPATGSGHILVEVYDLFKEIYLERGYSSKDFPRLILEKNLYGLDIDDRAAQMAGFALLMKARKDDRRILRSDNPPKMNVMAIQETGDKLREAGLWGQGAVTAADIDRLANLFVHGKTFGSLIAVPEDLAGKLKAMVGLVEQSLMADELFDRETARSLQPLVKQSMILAATYDCIVTNPPYMGSKVMNGELKAFIHKNYPDSKRDLFAAFVERLLDLNRKSGVIGLMTPFTWMFLDSYEKLRRKITDFSTIDSLIRPEYHAFFESAYVPICTFVVVSEPMHNYRGSFIDLSKFYGADIQSKKALEAIHSDSCPWAYKASSNDFRKLPGIPIAYWMSDRALSVFSNSVPLEEIGQPRQGCATSDNDRFLRLWYEVSPNKVSYDSTSLQDAETSGKRWFPYNKGGGFRKWYGNLEFVVNWEQNGREMKEAVSTKYPYLNGNVDYVVKNRGYYFRGSLSWSKITSGGFALRYYPSGFVFDVSGCSIFFDDTRYETAVLGCMNSPIMSQMLNALSPTLNFEVGQVAKFPIINGFLEKTQRASELVKNLIEESKADWNSFETSWDFTRLPLLHPDYRQPSLKTTCTQLRAHWREMTLEMRHLEEENNRIFISAYGVQDELTPEVPLNEITLTCNPHYRYGGDRTENELETLFLADTMRELISYSLGCMMGRYSLDEPGLIYANSGNIGFDPSRYKTFTADDDGIIPVMDMDWFPDDAASRFEEFLKVAWSPEALEENLRFVADSLSPKNGEQPRDKIRRYMSNQFFKDHLQTYKKRPIYWLFSSGKQKAFECLVYLHRYNEGTLSRMRNEYVTPLHGKLAARADYLKAEIDAASTSSSRNKLQKELEVIRKKQVELAAFDELLRHHADKRISLDLDDGVKVNYGKFGSLLAEVKAVTGTGE